MFGPSAWVIFSIHGKNFFGSSSPPRSDTDCTVTSWIGDGIAMMVVMVVVIMVMMVVVVVDHDHDGRGRRGRGNAGRSPARG